MNPAWVSLISVALCVCGVLFGRLTRTALPKEHLEGDSRDVIKLGVGMTASVTALVLGLVTASTKSSFDAVDTAVKDTATKLLVIDRNLARYGPEAAQIRVDLKQVVGERINMVWPADAARRGSPDPAWGDEASRVEALVDAIRALQSSDDRKKALQLQAASLAEDVLQARWVTMAADGTSVPLLFLVVVVSWQTLIFAIYGMFANTSTSLTTLLVCALSIGGALFLVLELDTPFDGLIQVSSHPLEYALAHINR